MRHDNNYANFGVYIHKNSTSIFIGTGLPKEVNNKYRRSEEHLAIWDDLDKYWYVFGVDRKTAKELQQQLLSNIDVNEYQVLNKNMKGIVVKPVKYEVVSRIYYIDESSPTILRWRINSGPKRAGDVAGSLNKSDGYYRVGYLGKSLQIYRVIYCLYHKKDLNGETVIDHIDRDKSNNHPLNLREVTGSDNNRNLDLSQRNKTGISGVYWENDLSLCRVTWYEDSCTKQKRLSLNPKKIFPNKNLEQSIIDVEKIAKEVRQIAEHLFYGKELVVDLNSRNSICVSLCNKIGFTDKLQKKGLV